MEGEVNITLSLSEEEWRFFSKLIEISLDLGYSEGFFGFEAQGEYERGNDDDTKREKEKKYIEKFQLVGSKVQEQVKKHNPDLWIGQEYTK